MTAIYSTGTVSVSNGDAVVTGSGTAWAASLVTAGMFSCAGQAIPILSVESDTSLTLAYAWPGDDAVGATYAIARENSGAASVVDLYDRLSRLLVTLSLAGITPNASGTIADRDAISLSTNDEGFLFLHAEIGVAFAFYRWTGTAWEGPFAVANAVASGGVTSIVAGTGVSVDSTNPDVPSVALADGGTTNAKLANMATARIKGRTTAGTGAPEDLTASQARTVMGLAAVAASGSAADLSTGTLPDARVSTTLGADKAFRRGTILGAVSQSSGVPTGLIIERGSNANGEYVRFADGTQICSMAYDATADAWSTVSGGLFISGSILWTYPAAFSGIVPTVFGGTSRSADEARGLGARNITSSAANLRFWSSVSIAATVAKSGQMSAIGRWF